LITIDSETVGDRLTEYPVETPTPFTTISPAATLSIDPSMEAIILQAKNDLSQKTGTDLEKIIVLEVEIVEWSDGSLGCPQPGVMYTQVLTPGYRILLEDNQKKYEYHSSRDVYVIYCENPNMDFLPLEP
jgi:hypothetical protein